MELGDPSSSPNWIKVPQITELSQLYCRENGQPSFQCICGHVETSVLTAELAPCPVSHQWLDGNIGWVGWLELLEWLGWMDIGVDRMDGCVGFAEADQHGGVDGRIGDAGVCRLDGGAAMDVMDGRVWVGGMNGDIGVD